MLAPSVHESVKTFLVLMPLTTSPVELLSAVLSVVFASSFSVQEVIDEVPHVSVVEPPTPLARTRTGVAVSWVVMLPEGWMQLPPWSV